MKVYIASSFRNLPFVRMLTIALLGAGHEVADWTALPAPMPAGTPAAERRRGYDSDASGRVFRFCSEACGSADLVIYLGPAGQDAACEVGMAKVAGVPVWGLFSPLEEPGLMLSGCIDRWFDDPAELLGAVEDFEAGAVCAP